MRVPDTYYDEAKARLADVRPAVGRAAAAQHPRRPRPRRVPAADLHRDDHRPAGGVLRDHRAPRRARASARATSRRCSRRSSATRTGAATSERVTCAEPHRSRHSPASRCTGPASRPRRSMAEHGIAEAIKLASQRVPVRPAARRSPRRSPRRSRRVEPLRRPRRRRLSPRRCAERFGRRPRPRRRRLRLGRPAAAAAAVVRRARATRSCIPWPSFIAYPHSTPRRWRCDVDRAAAPPGDRRRRARGRGHRPHPHGARRQPEQPDRHRGAHAPTSQRLARRRARSCLVVLDEAYHEFVTGRRRARRHRACSATARTSSCCARSRRPTGWPACASATWSADPTWSTPSTRRSIPFAVNGAAQAAALASLDQGDEVARRCRGLTGRAHAGRPGAAPAGLGCPTPRRTSVAAGGDAERRRWPLRSSERGVVTRPFDGGVRVTLGSPAENDRFLAALGDVAIDSTSPRTGTAPPGRGGEGGRLARSPRRRHGAVQRARSRSRTPGRTEPDPGGTERGTPARCGRTWPSSATTGSISWTRSCREPATSRSRAVRPQRRDAGRIAAIEAGRTPTRRRISPPSSARPIASPRCSPA